VGPVSTTISIDAPREHVHRLLADLAVRPSFTDHFIDEFRLERLDSAGVGAGARFRIPDRRLWIETVITDSQPPHRLSESGAGGRLDHRPVHTLWELVEAAGRSGCEVTVTFVIEPANPLDRLADAMRIRGREGWYRRRWARALARLKEIAESDAKPRRLAVAGAERIGV
jgi:hypothetical protein